MIDFEELQEIFRADLGQFLQTIQSIRVVDTVAFQKIDGEAEELARVLKGHSLVPKSLLNELRVATKILRAEAPYIGGGKNPLAGMADRLEMTLDLILKGECHGDRVPGVPRVL